MRCMVACNHCYTACLEEEDIAMMKECIRLDRQCADICGFAAQAMSTNSMYAREICRICAEVCEACGNECKKHCQECAEACLRCAKICREMAA